ncbi:MAG: hypothetical protein LUH05_03570 [Candidatus Gastranaerophilales bacterium]|nr:hypothetical protein [Candidatus Gastranaerophilales bacterium]
MPEINLFIIWDKARNKETEILKEIKTTFQILEVYEIEWDKRSFKNCLERFYCEKIRKKIKKIGTGKFLAVTILDNSPEYGYEETLKGYEKVNRKVLLLKKKLRKLTGGGYKIHAANNCEEVGKNLIFLLNKSYSEYYKYASTKVFDGAYQYINKSQLPLGLYCWNNLNEIFRILNSSCKYVVLRGFEDMTENGDIDLLVDDFQKVKYLLNAKVVYKQKYRCQVKTKIADKLVFFDLRSIGDDYYCEKWEEDILNNRIYDERGFYTPDKEDLLNTLIYHSIVHKKTVPHKYDELLSKLSIEVLNIKIEEVKNPYDIYNRILSDYMDKNDYYFVKPSDKKVYYNETKIKKSNWLRLLNKKYGFENIETYQVDKKPSSGFEFFFIADYQNKKVFLKCGSGNFYAKKEYKIIKYLHSQNSVYFVDSIMYRNLSDNRMFLCIECIQGTNLSDELIKMTSGKKLNNMFNSLYEISEILFKNKFIHRDINYSNLMAEEDGTIHLIDFQHLVGGEFKENFENIDFPKKLNGTNKRLRPFVYVWDDMYSIYNILIKFDGSQIKDYDVKMAALKSKIGKQRYFFFDNKFPLQSYLHFKSLIFFKILNSIFKPFRKFIIKRTCC